MTYKSTNPSAYYQRQADRDPGQPYPATDNETIATMLGVAVWAFAVGMLVAVVILL